jgi:hypothetical protein
MSKPGHTLRVLPQTLAVCRLDGADPFPEWVGASRFSSITRTESELSIVCEGALVPAAVRAVHGWRCFEVEGPFEFSIVGVIAALTKPLADADVSVFTVATFDTDYILVRGEDLERAICAFEASGHTILRDDRPRGNQHGTSDSTERAAEHGRAEDD